MKEIFIATKNKGKIKEILEIMKDIEGISIKTMLDGLNIPEVIEDKDTFEGNSIKKAVEIAKFLNCCTIADDSGICLEALNGAPGVYSARYAGENATDLENNEKLLKNIKDKENRNAKYVAVITFAYPDGSYKTFTGEVKGKIIDEYRGNNGFGYDPIFYVEEYGQTFGEISLEIKNKISHRGIALSKLKSELKNLIK